MSEVSSPCNPRSRTLNPEDVGSHPMMTNLVRHRGRSAGGPAQELIGTTRAARVVGTPRTPRLPEYHAPWNRCPAEPLPPARAAGVGSDVSVSLPTPEPGHVFRNMLSGNAEVGPGERLGIPPVLPRGLSMKGRMRFGLIADVLRFRNSCRISPALCRGCWGDDHSGADENEGDGHAHGRRLSFGVSKSRPRSGAAQRNASRIRPMAIG
jgi:hypothetical protein